MWKMWGLNNGFGEGVMETFVAKMCFGGGPRFDPLMEEKGGWIVREAQQHDVEMADVVIEVKAEERD